MRALLGSLAICAVGFAVYANALDAPFVYDDHSNIVENPFLRWTELDWDGLRRAAFEGRTSRPISNVSFALNYYFGGGEPRGYRLVNVWLHIVNAILVALLAQVTLTRLGARSPRNWLPLFAGLLFVVHPLQIQSVTYIVQRMNALATLFYLLALLLYLRGRLAEVPAARWGAWFGAGVCWLLALGSKENAITLPFAIWLYEWAFFQGFSADWARRKSAYLIAPAVGLGLLLYLYTEGFQGYRGREFDLGERLLTQLRVVVLYLSLVVFPHPARLNLLHDLPISHSLFDPLSTCASLLALLALVALAAYWARRQPLVAFSILWFLLHLALESSVLPLEMVYEHRTYLSMAGVGLVTPYLLFSALHTRTAVAFSVLLVAALAFATHARNQTWRSEVSLWADVVSKSPGHAGAHNNLGLALSRAGRLEEALPEYTEAIRLDPTDPEFPNNLGTTNTALGRSAEAIRHYEATLRLAPNHFRAHHNLGMALAEEGRLDAGLLHVAAAAQIAPFEAGIHNSLGALYLRQDLADEAIRSFSQAIRLDPAMQVAQRNLRVVLDDRSRRAERDDAEGRALRADALANRGAYEEAVDRYRAALELDSETPRALAGLGVSLAEIGRHADAIPPLAEAVRIAPELHGAANNLAWILATAPDPALHDPARAIALAEGAVDRPGPPDPGLLDTLAAAYAAAGRFEDAVGAARRAEHQADVLGPPALLHAIRNRLSLYRERRAYRSARASR